MRDFKNYKTHIEFDMRDYSGKFHFNEQLKQEGSFIKLNELENQLINNVSTPIKAIVRNTGIENKEGNEERSIIIGKEYDYKSGDYVEYLGDIYITTTCVDKDNPFFNTAKMKRCNHLLKWMDNGQLYQTPSIVTNNTKYTEGTKTEVSGITEQSAMFNILVPDILKTKMLLLDKRFIINSMAWKVTLPDRTNQGLLFLTLGKSSINQETDNLELGIADYYTVKHDYKFDIPSNFNVTKDTNIKLSYSILDNLKDIDYMNLVSVEYSGNLIQVTKTDKDITITGKELGTGSIKLKVNLTNETKEFNITFNVVQAIVNEVKYNVTTSNGYEYRIKEGSQISAFRYVNGIVDDTLQIDYILSQLGQDLLSKGSISIVKKTQNSLQIRNEKINTSMTFTLTIVNKTTGDKILDNQVITLKGVL